MPFVLSWISRFSGRLCRESRCHIPPYRKRLSTPKCRLVGDGLQFAGGWSFPQKNQVYNSKDLRSWDWTNAMDVCRAAHGQRIQWRFKNRKKDLTVWWETSFLNPLESIWIPFNKSYHHEQFHPPFFSAAFFSHLKWLWYSWRIWCSLLAPIIGRAFLK